MHNVPSLVAELMCESTPPDKFCYLRISCSYRNSLTMYPLFILELTKFMFSRFDISRIFALLFHVSPFRPTVIIS